MKITIRESVLQDLPEILDIYNQLGMDDGNALSLPQAEVLWNNMAAYPNYKVFVATHDKQIIGVFELAIMDNLAHQGAASGIVEDVAVKEQWQGKGVGTQMMRFAIDRCREYGCYKVALSSNRKREAAHRFYESLGFEKHGYSFRLEL